MPDAKTPATTTAKKTPMKKPATSVAATTKATTTTKTNTKTNTKTTRATAKKAPPADVESYLAGVPADAVAALRALRKAIREAAPEADEVISYGVPTYKHRGPLVSFAATTGHCAFYVMSPGPIATRKTQLAGYDTAPSAIRFPASEPLPAALVKAIVKDRIAENEAK